MFKNDEYYRIWQEQGVESGLVSETRWARGLDIKLGSAPFLCTGIVFGNFFYLESHCADNDTAYYVDTIPKMLPYTSV